MNKVNFPLQKGSKGQEVAKLFVAIKKLIKNKKLKLNDQFAKDHGEQLNAEIAEKFFGEATAQLIYLFREQYNCFQMESWKWHERNKVNYTVDESIANKINVLVKGLGRAVTDDTKQLIIEQSDLPLKQGMKNKPVDHLQKQLDYLGFFITDQPKYFGRSTRQVIEQFQNKHDLDVTGVVNEETYASISNELKVNAEPFNPGQPLSLDKEILLALEEKSDYSPLDLKPSDNKIFSLLQSMATNELTQFLAEYFKDSPDRLREEIANIDLVNLVDQQTDVQSELLQILDKLVEAEGSTEELATARIHIRELEHAGMPQNPMDIDLPLVDHPLTQNAIQQARIYRLGNSVKLPEDKIEKILEISPSLFSLDDNVLQSLVKENTLDDKEAKKLGLATNLYQLLDENISFTELIVNKEQFKINSLKDLVSLEISDWQKLVKNAGVTPPNSISRSEYAELLTKRIETLYPNETLHARLKIGDYDKLETRLESLTPLFKDNKSVFVNWSFESLKTDYMTETEKKKAHTEFNKLQLFVNRYPGLQLTEVLDEWEDSIPQMMDKISTRVGLLDKFQEQNRDVELLALDYMLESKDVLALDLNGFSEQEQQMVFANMKARQRVYTLTGDVSHIHALFEAGYHSSLQLAQADIATIQQKTKLGAKTVKQYLEQAKAKMVAVTSGAMTLVDLHSGGFNLTATSNIQSEISDSLLKLNGYETFFGNQTYCKCKHCQSVLSPAAYFVDLMSVVEDKILNPSFPDNATHPIHLKNRRSDLWTLELSCENTHTLVPTLDIINEILENYICQVLNKRLEKPSGARPTKDNRKINCDTKDRSVVEDFVYGDEKGLAQSQNSFHQPFMLPQEKLQVYLQHFNLTRADVARLLEVEQPKIAQAALKISKKEYELITEKSEDTGFLKNLYGIKQRFTKEFEELNVQQILKPMGISRSELEELLNTQFVVADDDSIQYDIERIYNLNYKHLGRMHRFTRLWRQLDWSISELDFVLTLLKDQYQNKIKSKYLKEAQSLLPVNRKKNKELKTLKELLERRRKELNGITGEINLEEITTISHIKEQLFISVEQVCILWADFTEITLSDKKQLLDRLFNIPPFGRPIEGLPSDNLFLHPYYFQQLVEENANEKPDKTNALFRLCAGLGISDEELLQLITLLKLPQIPEKPKQGNKTSKRQRQKSFGFKLNRQNLSLLYRHALLAKQLKVSIAEFFHLIKYAGIESGYIENLETVTTLLKFNEWWQQQNKNYSFDDLALITGIKVEEDEGKETNDFYDSKKIALEIIETSHNTKALEFSDTLFAFIPGLTEELSQQIIEDNHLKVIEKNNLTGLYRVTSVFSLTTELYLSEKVVNEMVILSGKGKEAARDFLLSETTKVLIDHQVSDQNPEPREFNDNVFHSITNVNDQLSRQIIEDNYLKTIEKSNTTNNSYRISTALSLTKKLIISDDIVELLAKTKEIEIKDAEGYFRAEFLKYHASELIPVQLAAKLNLSVEKIKALIEITDEDLFNSEYTKALQDQTLEPIKDLVELVLPLTVLFKNTIYDKKALNFIHDHQEIFPIDGLNNNKIKLEERINRIQELSIYTKFADISDDLGFSAEELKVEQEALHKSLESLHQGTSIENANVIAQALCIEPALVSTIINALKTDDLLSKSAPEALLKIARCAEQAKYLGVGGDTLRLIVANTYSELSLASDALLGAFRAKYTDEKQWKEKVDPFEDRIRSLKRDALTDYLIHSIQPKIFKSEREIYQHFLIDVELTGCARTSRLVAAISSVQLYVHRVLINLEQSEKGAHVTPNDRQGFINEWKWRKNYRVWEANRKVFLFPETYIEPELRDNKTPLFEELESTLLQQEVNEQNVLDAYAVYMTGFEEVAKLKIAGSYHDKRINAEDEDVKDILHLFGVTPSDPPIYYYRAIENAHYGEVEENIGIVWTPWRKIEVQIPVRKVSPIVFQGRLYVFWVEIVTTPKNKVKNGSSKFVGYKHKLSVKYTMLRLDDTWTVPQDISLPDKIGVVKDLLAEESEITLLENELTISLNDDEIKKYKKLIESTQPSSPSELSDIIRESQSKEVIFSTNWNTLISKLFTPTYSTVPHLEPEDGYTLTGVLWDQVYPSIDVIEEVTKKLDITIAGNQVTGQLDLYSKSLLKTETKATAWRKVLYFSDSNKLIYKPSDDYYTTKFGLKEYDGRSLLLNLRNSNDLSPLSQNIIADISNRFTKKSFNIIELNNGDQVDIINGSLENYIIDSNGDLFFLQNYPWPCSKEVTGIDLSSINSRFYSWHFLLKRLGTTKSEEISRILFSEGIDALLDINNQEKLLTEHSIPIVIENKDFVRLEYEKNNEENINKVDFTGSYGTYYREIFFHIPFLIANHLNSQQKFEAAQHWYQYIFDPTANIDTGLPVGDSNWRYLEFRNLGLPKLREMLQDKEAREAYKDDPFNPHAIARLRLTAYQKSIVMKYIDNLLDWGDKLFSQFTMESVNEATMLYIMAADILGEHPVEIGDCGEGELERRDYEHIKPLMGESEFLIEVESLTVNKDFYTKTKPDYEYSMDSISLLKPMAISATLNNSAQNEVLTTEPLMRTDWNKAHIQSWRSSPDIYSRPEYDTSVLQENSEGGSVATIAMTDSSPRAHNDIGDGFVSRLLYQVGPVFCFPVNKELLSYWDRVDDRLYKIRHCMDIKGVRRNLELFAPEIDPRLLVRAKAAGLSIEDVLEATSGDLPPYRFAYLIERAKAYANTVQGFGASLLSALEKKDSEELSRLKLIHEQNIQKLSTKIKEWEVNIESEGIQTLQLQREAAEYNKNYYEGLIDEGLLAGENYQVVALHSASLLHVSENILAHALAKAKVQPQYGSAFSLNYGGRQLGGFFGGMVRVYSALARSAEIAAASVDLESKNTRREDGWKHQLKLAKHELKQVEKKLLAAEIRKNIAKKSLDLHKKNIEQSEEMFQLYGSKFSNFGLYTWLSKTMHGLYRDAYNSAFSMARLAEQAYQFERGYDSTFSLGSGSWEASKAGLLAGERLLINLQHMEQRFIETNYRSMEIDQSFSVAQINPEALITLREKGSCNFEIPELFFDLFYPGHYRRKIKAVRISIPCITGPYVNVGASLKLTGSKLRNQAKLDTDNENYLKNVPLQRSVSIATSKAQNDAGVFEFNFHDERYMPFEGAGAISDWMLTLPESFRQFDYETISDVVLHISYTAEESEVLKGKVQTRNTEIEDDLIKTFKAQGLVQAFSMKNDFSTEWHRFLEPTINMTDFVLRIEPVRNVQEGKETVDKFETEFKDKKKNTLLLVSFENNPDKCKIAGFDDQAKFKSTLIDDSNSALFKELKKETADESKILELIALNLGITRTLKFIVGKERFPFFVQKRKIVIDEVSVFVKCSQGSKKADYMDMGIEYLNASDSRQTKLITELKFEKNKYGELKYVSLSDKEISGLDVTKEIGISYATMNVENIFLLIYYELD